MERMGKGYDDPELALGAISYVARHKVGGDPTHLVTILLRIPPSEKKQGLAEALVEILSEPVKLQRMEPRDLMGFTKALTPKVFDLASPELLTRVENAARMKLVRLSPTHIAIILNCFNECGYRPRDSFLHTCKTAIKDAPSLNPQQTSKFLKNYLLFQHKDEDFYDFLLDQAMANARDCKYIDVSDMFEWLHYAKFGDSAWLLKFLEKSNFLELRGGGNGLPSQIARTMYYMAKMLPTESLDIYIEKLMTDVSLNLSSFTFSKLALTLSALSKYLPFVERTEQREQHVRLICSTLSKMTKVKHDSLSPTRDYTMILQALVALKHEDPAVLSMCIDYCTQHISSFNPQALVTVLNTLSFYGSGRDPILTSTVKQHLLRKTGSLSAAGVAITLHALAQMGAHVHSDLDDVPLVRALLQRAEALTEEGVSGFRRREITLMVRALAAFLNRMNLDRSEEQLWHSLITDRCAPVVQGRHHAFLCFPFLCFPFPSPATPSSFSDSCPLSTGGLVSPVCGC